MSEGTQRGGLAEHVVGVLEPLLGPHTAANAVRVACDKLGLAPDSLSRADAEAVSRELAPMLRTLLGRAAAERVRERILAAGGAQ